MWSLGFALMIAYLDYCICQNECEKGWFGSQCQFLCHCRKGCDVSGSCLEGSLCSLGWFGLYCQYNDQIQNEDTFLVPSPAQEVNYLSDGNEDTCVGFSKIDNISIIFASPFVFTFIRFYVPDVNTVNVSISFTNAERKEEPCKTNRKKLAISRNWLDIHCQPSMPVGTVKLKFWRLDKMCSLYVSGGRNMAYGQLVQHDSTEGSLGAELVIDSNKGDTKEFCSMTTDSSNSTAMLTITFLIPVILNRVILYNRGDALGNKLSKFTLRAYDDDKNLLIERRDTSDEVFKTYTILLPVMEQVRRITVSAARSKDSETALLSLCEMETFGDCPSHLWGLSCNMGCPDICVRGCEINRTCNYMWSESDSKCPIGFFGEKCRYKCHCRGGCEEMSNCHLFPCESGWFGLLCQYRDLLHPEYSNVTVRGLSAKSLLDYNNNTCVTFVNETNQIHVQFHTPSFFTFLRLNSQTVKELHVSITYEAINGSTMNCHNRNKALIVRRTNLDIYCGLSVPVKSLTVTVDGSIEVCSIYLSGGRNLAYGQKVALSSLIKAARENTFGSAYKAIDGQKSPRFYDYGCTHSDPYVADAHFNLTFDIPIVLSRIKLYNRDIVSQRLRGFVLSLLNAKSKKIFEYQDQLPDSRSDYSIVVQNLTDPVWRIVVRATAKLSQDPQPIITLCEMETYGDCIPGTWGLDCNKTCEPLCNNLCSSMDGSCLFTCMYGTLLPDCRPDCPVGKYGPGCGLNCSLHCSRRICHSLSGLCRYGCLGFKDPPHCRIACERFRYGQNCLKTCSDSCWNKTCDDKTGVCVSDCNGFLNPPLCNEVCFNGSSYGKNCEKLCTHCLDQQCHHKTGNCLTGCLGYLDFPHCHIRCPKGRYGVNCTTKCHTNCYGGLCNRTSGDCVFGCDNFQDPPYCVTPCNGSHGLNCLCHEMCQECHNMSSQCANCKIGLNYNRERNMCFEVAVDYSRLGADQGVTDQMSRMLPFLYLAIGLAEVVVFVAAIYRKRKGRFVANEDGGF